MPSRPAPPRPRNVITLDLPQEMVRWLDAKAGGVMSRSAFARFLIDQAMRADTDSRDA
jgi:metal-responsive CopG/Arc/MetJ family transcriptional regulator